MINTAKPTLVTGGCGFVGRHVVAYLLKQGVDVWIIDDLSVGKHPGDWLAGAVKEESNGPHEQFLVGERRITFVKADVLRFMYDAAKRMDADALPDFGDIIHLASIVGGRALIDGDPIQVAVDLGIDACFFLWLTRFPKKAERILYASSSAAYPTSQQGSESIVNLTEDLISFNGGALGQPDMTYGWSKLTGEYLAHLAATRYGLHVACIRPFSGYGEDQDESYPVPAIATRVAARQNPLTVWGTGEQARDFVYIDDCVEAMFVILDHVSDGRGVNVGTGVLTSFNDLCRLFAKLEGYAPTIQPLIDKPVGVHNRVCNPELIFSFGWKPSTSLEEGMGRVLAARSKK